MKQQVSVKTYLGTILVLAIIAFAGITFVRSAGEIPVSPASFATESSYIVEIDGSEIYMKDGTTGAEAWRSTNSSVVINCALGNLTSGRTWKERVLLKGNFSIDSYSFKKEPPSAKARRLFHCHRLFIEPGRLVTSPELYSSCSSCQPIYKIKSCSY